MPIINESTIARVLDVYQPERSRLIELLSGLEAEQWDLPTECPAYSVKGIATHILGDDLSLLSRQRDEALPGLFLIAESMPGADFRELLDGFNDQWVAAAQFFSPAMLLDLLQLVGRWTHSYYSETDPATPCEPVALFGGAPGEPSPLWHAISREYLERWAHHSQIRRALGLGSLADSPFLDVGHDIIATVSNAPTERGGPASDDADTTWEIGPVVLGDRLQAADILTLAHTAGEVAEMVTGPAKLVDAFSAGVGRR